MSQKELERTPDTGTGVDPRVARHGGLSYLEISAIDLHQSAAFYEQLLGWKLDWRSSDDCRFDDGSGYLIGRWVTSGAISREPGLLPYFYVDRLDDAIERATAHRGEVVRRPTPKGTSGSQQCLIPPAT